MTVFNKIAQSNLGKGLVATRGGIPTYSRSEQLFNHIRQVAPICTRFIGSTLLTSPNAISSESAVRPEFTVVTNGQTDTELDR